MSAVVVVFIAVIAIPALIIVFMMLARPIVHSSAIEPPPLSKEQRLAAFKLQRQANREFAAQALAAHSDVQLLHIDDQKCIAGVTQDALCIEGYPLFETKAVSEIDIEQIDLRSILSVEMVDSTRLVRRMHIERDTELVHHRRSPVTRGLVGAVALGPVGMVLGAASGLNSKVELKHRDRKVTKMVEAAGPPSIVLGTNLPTRPMIKLRAASKAKTEEWFYRLRATLAA